MLMAWTQVWHDACRTGSGNQCMDAFLNTGFLQLYVADAAVLPFASLPMLGSLLAWALAAQGPAIASTQATACM